VRLETDDYESLVEVGVVSEAQLDEAYAILDSSGGSLVEILTSAVGADQVAVARELAWSARTDYVNLDLIPTVDPSVLGSVDRDRAVAHLFAAIGPTQGYRGVTVAVMDPFDRELLDQVHAALSGDFAVVVSTPGQISALLNRCYGEAAVRVAAMGLKESDPDNSASPVMSSSQAMFTLALIPALVVFIVGALSVVALIFNSCTMVLYAASSIFRMRLINIATNPARQRPSYDAPPLAGDADLPVYSILVPMYHEAGVVGNLLLSLGNLDYPAQLLDILLICEEDDAETIDAVRELNLPSQFRLLVVPDSAPKTKPKACNYALQFARGQMAVIYDAEDLPEADQLRRVLSVFADAGDELACVQARLQYWNWNTNLLTRWFTIEYTMWFDLILPGLEQVDAPVPLGGTSNHFRMTVLRELGGWDPFNVTEDADLGIRLHKMGYRTLNVESTTFEEANSHLGNWIRQRSRWMKGHMQTWLVHNRNPRRTIRELGWRPYVYFQLLIGMGVFGALLNPIYWALIILWAVAHTGIISQDFPSIVAYLAALNLLIWNFAFVYAAAAGVARRGAWALVLYAFISPLYWALMSFACWKGLFQLITRPFYWEKTVHGLDTNVPPPVPAAASARLAAVVRR
jgi:cellulose synthase/poly-beta-1,6-N-acetylglucosamine synthase-like glycosyltransferase